MDNCSLNMPQIPQHMRKVRGVLKLFYHSSKNNIVSLQFPRGHRVSKNITLLLTILTGNSIFPIFSWIAGINGKKQNLIHKLKICYHFYYEE